MDAHGDREKGGPWSRRALALEALAWQVDAGVTATLAEASIDRFAPEAETPERARAAAAPRETSDAAPRRASVATPEARKAGAMAEAEVAAAGADTLEALAAAIAAFRGSGLEAGARTCVVADGRPDAPLMVIGEAPGAEEDRVGKPFVGRSGKLLDAMLGAIGLSRDATEASRGFYVTNLVPWRPPGNRAPDDAEATLFLPFLRRHIALVRPKAVLCVGALAAKHAMGAQGGISRVRGAWGEIAVEGRSVPALATFHPAYLLRTPEMKRLAWRDLLALAERLELPIAP